MKRFLISIVLASAVFSVGAMAQSAKFTAASEDEKVALAEFNINYTATGDAIVTAEETMGKPWQPSTSPTKKSF